MTEDEAKTKRCCGPDGCGFTDPRQADCLNGERWCIGSECVAWRWTDQQTLADAQDWIHADPTRLLQDFKPRNPTKGYCGLAAAPVCS